MAILPDNPQPNSSDPAQPSPPAPPQPAVSSQPGPSSADHTQQNAGFLDTLRSKSIIWTANSLAAIAPVIATLSIVISFGIFVIVLSSVFVPYLFTSSLDPSKTLLHQLGDTTIARGLITFLVALSTVAIGLFLVLFVAVSDKETKERFSYGKEVLTALVGILGTIIGFYFGQGTMPGSTKSATNELAITELKVQPDKPKKSDEISLLATTVGGRPPYFYVVRFTPNSIPPITGYARDGQLNIKFKLPADYDASKPLGVELLDTDAADAFVRKRLNVDVAQ